MGQDPGLAALAGAYVHTLQWAMLPAWGFIVLRSFISVLERPMWSLVIGLGAVGFNAAANWCLMLGHCGCRPLGIAGSGLATLLSSVLMVPALAIVASVARPFRRYRLFAARVHLAWPRLREFWRLGLPMAATLSFEVTMFNAAVFLMGLIGAASLAAHSIAIQLASLTFMVPLGISQAATVRIGRALGRHDREAIHRAGWTALGLATAFMAAMSVMMIVAPRLLISAFLDTHEPANAVVVGARDVVSDARGDFPDRRRRADRGGRHAARPARCPHAHAVRLARLLGDRPATGRLTGVRRRAWAASGSGSVWQRGWRRWPC